MSPLSDILGVVGQPQHHRVRVILGEKRYRNICTRVFAVRRSRRRSEGKCISRFFVRGSQRWMKLCGNNSYTSFMVWSIDDCGRFSTCPVIIFLSKLIFLEGKFSGSNLFINLSNCVVYTQTLSLSFTLPLSLAFISPHRLSSALALPSSIQLTNQTFNWKESCCGGNADILIRILSALVERSLPSPGE